MKILPLQVLTLRLHSWTLLEGGFYNVRWSRWVHNPRVPLPSLIDSQQIDHISLPALAKRGIKLGYTPDVLTDAGLSCFEAPWTAHATDSPLKKIVADLCIMLVLMASRSAGFSMKVVREGEVRYLEAI